MNIRESVQSDFETIESLYPEAFPDEDLLPVVRELLRTPKIVLSLVAAIDSKPVAHVIFTDCEVAGTNIKAALLAPLAVAPRFQRQGIGSAIVRNGLERLQQAGVQLTCVLGDPAYYSRLGFNKETLVEPPYRLPAEWESAWQSQYVGDSATTFAGRLSVPPQWQQPALWLPA
jgi:putative acetyltransferase